MIKFIIILLVLSVIIILWDLRSKKLFSLEYTKLDLTKAVIHHSVSNDVSVKTINKWHKKRGFNEIGYHYVIRQDGSLEKGRSLTKRGAHTEGRNDLIGICLTGKDLFTDKQINCLKILLVYLKIDVIQNHHGECPGPGLNLTEIAWDLIIKFEEH